VDRLSHRLWRLDRRATIHRLWEAGTHVTPWNGQRPLDEVFGSTLRRSLDLASGSS